MACLFAFALLRDVAAAPPWRAGVASVDITPETSIWLAGYAARREPSRGVAQPIHAKALALQSEGARLVIVTTDLLGLPRDLADRVAARIGKRHDLRREQILLTASHSHSAPVIADRLVGMYRLDGTNRQTVARYTRRVEDAMVRVAGGALESLSPARLSFAHGRATFARNRRRVNPDDPQDHDVAVLLAQIDRQAAPRRAILFEYACHNTVLDGLEICGDYAGFAQSYLESSGPGTTALFVSGCGGDINPEPRRRMELARQHGRELADAVLEAIGGPRERVAAGLSAALDHAALPLVAAPPRATIENQLEDANVYVRIRARQLLSRLDAGEDLDAPYPLPVQVWRLGPPPDSGPGGFTLVALGGEVVIDYALRLRRELGAYRLMVAAYANDCPAYIPSERVLREGGYEGGGAMLYYGFHGPWAPGVEERVVATIHEAHRRAGGGPGTAARGGIFEASAELERLWTGGEFTEGPAVSPTTGDVYFTDIPARRIMNLKSGGSVSVLREDSGRANGLAFDAAGRLIVCEGAAPGGRGRVVRLENDGSTTVLAEKIEGRRLDDPNDLAIDRHGRIYFSDPRHAGDGPRALDRGSVYRIDAPGKISRVTTEIEEPNGLAMSTDGGELYVSDTAARKLFAFALREDGSLGERRTVFDFSPGRAIDGMALDAEGNIYGAAGEGERSGIHVISPTGELLAFLPVPETVTNCAFGGRDGRTLFVTAGRSLYRARIRHPGSAAEPGSGE